MKNDVVATAYHEAGHTLLHMALDLGCEGVSIVPVDSREGAAAHGGEWGKPARNFGEQDDEVSTPHMSAEDAACPVPGIGPVGTPCLIPGRG